MQRVTKKGTEERRENEGRGELLFYYSVILAKCARVLQILNWYDPFTTLFTLSCCCYNFSVSHEEAVALYGNSVSRDSELFKKSLGKVAKSLMRE